MKIILGILNIIVAICIGLQAAVIARVGAVNQIPQLEGDGGAGLLFSLLILVAVIFYFVKPIFSIPLFILAALTGILASLIYSDPVMIAWSIAPLFMVAFLLLNRRIRFLKQAKMAHLAKK
ncbi:hypothetical protein LSG31_21435 [Fodinisporobacter ferrooxydans]|uniref:Lipoprotein n=1 Tax=Fodinisporobacter ferrooxydans TaxID=2901836 RepID=A0ABY4CIQ2_9BACL|nr:hypothetical protein LSG31_21435 [Alicyclobacillaceae bacterium MYW30-H2]